MSKKRTLRWIIAHHPVELFQRTAELFKQELEKECPNQFDVEIYSLGTYANKYNKPEFLVMQPDITGLEYALEEIISPITGEKINRVKANNWEESQKKWRLLFNGLKNGEFEISQTQINIVGQYLDRDYHAIDLPFLFDSHDHVSNVLDGQIGDTMGEKLSKTGIRGLAFTYSGGYRVIGAKKDITSLKELSDLKLLTQTASSNELFNNIGAKTIKKYRATVEDYADMSEDNSSAVETTYLRFAGKHVLKTHHSMFVTTILTGNKFWNTLTSEQKSAFKKIAKIVAKEERKWSINDAANYENNARNNGITIKEINKSDLAKLQESAKNVYSNLNNIGINKSLVEDIVKAGKKITIN